MRFKVLRGLALAAAISLSAIVSFMGWVGTGFSGPGNDVHSFLSQWLPVSFWFLALCGVVRVRVGLVLCCMATASEIVLEWGYWKSTGISLWLLTCGFLFLADVFSALAAGKVRAESTTDRPPPVSDV